MVVPVPPPDNSMDAQMEEGQAEVERDRAINKYQGPERTWDDGPTPEPDRLGGTESQAPGQAPGVQQSLQIPPSLLALHPSFSALASGVPMDQRTLAQLAQLIFAILGQQRPAA